MLSEIKIEGKLNFTLRRNLCRLLCSDTIKATKFSSTFDTKKPYIITLCPQVVHGLIHLKWYYDENRIFPIAAILKHKQVACVRRKMLFTTFKYLFVPEIFKFLKYANCTSDVIHNQILIKYDEKDISANLNQKCSILCSKILLDVLHNMSCSPLAFHFDIC